MAQIPTNSPAAHPRIANLTQAEKEELLPSDRSFLVLQAMKGRTAPFELSDIAVAVAIREPELDANDEGTIDRVKTSLHHCLLPKLSDLDVLDYDPETNVIER
jgi:hypothetical protein